MENDADAPIAREGEPGYYLTPITTIWNFGFQVMKLDADAIIPTKANPGDLGYDLYALEDVTLAPNTVTKVHTGIACGFPYGYGALIRDRSSVATKKEVFVVAGVIDQGYTGEIIVAFFNPGQVATEMDYSGTRLGGERKVAVKAVHMVSEVSFKKGDKIAQLILMPVFTVPITEVTSLQATSRGSHGFGSSGK